MSARSGKFLKNIVIWLVLGIALLVLKNYYVVDTDTDVLSMRMQMFVQYLMILITAALLGWLIAAFVLSRSKRVSSAWYRIGGLVIYTVAFLIVYFVFHLITDTYFVFLYSVADGKKLDKSVYCTDSLMGYRHQPWVQAKILFPSGLKKSISINGQGFRTGLSKLDSAAVNVLLLGCSYTFGEGVTYEESFAGYLQDSCNFKITNAGVNGYGLAQIKYNTRELLPKLKPDIVVVQYSPWLAIRAISRYAPALTESIATPYFYLEKGKLTLHQPDFYARAIAFDFAQYTGAKPKSLRQKCLLFLKIMSDYTPICLYDYSNKLFYDIKFLLTLHKHIFTAKALYMLEETVYAGIKDDCAQANVPLLIVAISDPQSEARMNFKNWSIEGVSIVNADSVLYANITDKKDYYKTFGIFDKQGQDSVLVDYHPNSAAHKLIGQSICPPIHHLK